MTRWGAIPNETERDSIAMQILGKSAQDLNPLIAQGSAGMAELTQKAHEMGAVLSDDTMNSLGAMDDSMQIFKSTPFSSITPLPRASGFLFVKKGSQKKRFRALNFT